jgi:hypothetical protein
VCGVRCQRRDHLRRVVPAVAIEYHGHSFWIADTDIQSKASFGFVMLLFSISGTGGKSGAPVVTVPAQ